MLSLVNETILERKRNALPALGTSCQVWDVFPAYHVFSDAISTHTVIQPFRKWLNRWPGWISPTSWESALSSRQKIWLLTHSVTFLQTFTCILWSFYFLCTISVFPLSSWGRKGRYFEDWKLISGRLISLNLMHFNFHFYKFIKGGGGYNSGVECVLIQHARSTGFNP